jgi:hypothetical protein
LAADRSLSSNDRRHVFNLSIVYQPPVFRKGLVQTALGGWEISSLTSILSGAPGPAVEDQRSPCGGDDS